MSEPLTREQLEHVCEHGIKVGHDATRCGTVFHILATDAALRQQLVTVTQERDKQKLYAQGYYNQASEGWTKFREAERQLAERDKQLMELTGAHDQLVEQLAAMDKAQQARDDKGHEPPYGRNSDGRCMFCGEMPSDS